MALFDKILHENESFIKDFDVLDFSYMPKLIPYREAEQRQIAFAIKPLFDKANGQNLLIHGVQGIGKTIACKKVLEELEEYDGIQTIYINCWQHNTEFKIFNHLNDVLGTLISSNKIEDMQKKVIDAMNAKSVVIVLDEVDKLDKFDIIYSFLEQVYRKSILLVTNYKDIVGKIDPRISSRLNLNLLEFKPYRLNEIKGILQERVNFAFYDNSAFDQDAFDKIVDYTFDTRDVRKGLALIKESAMMAEQKAMRKVSLQTVNDVLEQKAKTAEYKVNETSELGEDETIILSILKEQTQPIKIGDLFDLYQKKDGKKSYKTVQRSIDKLVDGKFVTVEKIHTREGSTTVINLNHV